MIQISPTIARPTGQQRSGSDDSLRFFITRIGEEGSPERDHADGVTDAIVKPAAKELGLECIRADQLPDPGQITTQMIDRIVAAKSPRPR